MSVNKVFASCFCDCVRCRLEVYVLLSNELKPHYPVAVLQAFKTSAVMMFVVATCNFGKLYIKLNNEENSILINIIFDYKSDSYNL